MNGYFLKMKQNNEKQNAAFLTVWLIFGMAATYHFLLMKNTDPGKAAYIYSKTATKHVCIINGVGIQPIL